MPLARIKLNASLPVTRRSVVATGVRLAYAAPLVAASFALGKNAVVAADYCGDCIQDSLSPKPLEGGCYTCKAAEANCVSTRSGVQAVDFSPGAAGGLACVCQGNSNSNGKSHCVINGVEYDPGQVIDDGVCHPVNVVGNPAYDICVSGVSPV